MRIQRALTPMKGAAGIDPDAQAFYNAVVAAGGTPPPIAVIDRLVRDLKGEPNIYATANVWGKLVEVKPYCGATAASTAINLVNTLTYNTSWYNSPSFVLKGVQFNASTNTYGNAGMNLKVVFPTGNLTIGLWVEYTGGGTYNYDYGCYTSAKGPLLGNYWLGGSVFGGFRDGGSYYMGPVSSPPTQCFATWNTDNANPAEMYINGVFAASASAYTDDYSNDFSYDGQLNNLSSSTFNSNQLHKFKIISANLTPSEQPCVYNSINAFLINSGRI